MATWKWTAVVVAATALPATGLIAAQPQAPNSGTKISTLAMTPETAVSDDYKIPFPFTGTLARLTLDIDRPKLSPEDKRMLEQSNRNNRASE